MFFCYPLSSGSRGNCYLFSDGISSILIDCGIGPRVIKRNIDQEIKVFHAKINKLEMDIQNKKNILQKKRSKDTTNNLFINNKNENNKNTNNADKIINQPTFLDFVKVLSYDQYSSDTTVSNKEDEYKNISNKLNSQNVNDKKNTPNASFRKESSSKTLEEIHFYPHELNDIEKSLINKRQEDTHRNLQDGIKILERDLLQQKQILKTLQNLTIDAVFISHAHTDHIGGCKSLEKSFVAGKLARKNPSKNIDLNVPFYMSYGTVLESKSKHLPDNYKLIKDGDRIVIGNLTIEAFEVPHDAPETLAYRVSNGQHWAGVVTDLGYVPPKVIDKMRTMTFLALEFNYDDHMLNMGDYPFYLKDRIRGNLGHLSNEQAERVLMEVASPTLHHVVLAHISQNNNTPAIACKHATQALWKTGFSEDIKIHYTQQRTPLYPIIINDNSYHDSSYKEELSSPVELQNVELQNVELQNVELQNVELQEITTKKELQGALIESTDDLLVQLDPIIDQEDKVQEKKIQ